MRLQAVCAIQHQPGSPQIISSYLFLFSCSSRSCSSLSRCSRARLRFSASTRAASSGSLVPAEGLLVGAAGAEEEEEEGAAGAGEAATEASAGGADASMAETAGEAGVAAGGVGEGGEVGPAGTGLEPVTETEKKYDL